MTGRRSQAALHPSPLPVPLPLRGTREQTDLVVLRGIAHTTLLPNNVHVLAETSAHNMRGDNSVGDSEMYFMAVLRAIRAVFTHHRYRPELHYMRGPGPKWFERHGR